MKHLRIILLWAVTGLSSTGRTVNSKVPQCRGGSNLWCDPTNYPAYKVTEMLSKNESINQFLEKDKPLSYLIDLHYLPIDRSFENVCDEKTEYIYPKAAKNDNGEFLFIVNNPDGSFKHRQMVRVTTCTRPNEECGQGEVFRSTTSCVQEYSDHKLVALSKTGEELVVDTFSFPSCCICKVNIGLEF